MAYRIKDPSEVIVYGFDWGPWLQDDATLGTALVASDWSVSPAGLTLTDLEHESGVAKVRASGGTLGQVYRVTNHVVTDGDDEGERSHVIRIAER